ncbi:hypothetical protein [Accumulibacter sp.]|uniref:hypothetical protein n=1 Tax=Accumulibacter sp. TaxID=2053492 RepID=UPI00258543E2|nr:hypothetical protein [Accumulibacter sp.]
MPVRAGPKRRRSPFFDQSSEKKQALGWEAVLSPHMESAKARMRQHPVVLCLQDTAELDFNAFHK